MANEVYANGREVSCKAGSGKSVAAFPDVCFTPPLTPATPPGVPIPYPNTGMTSDTSGGSKTVKISGKEVMLKDSSYFSTSTGDEAGCAPKKNVITSKIKGKVYFTCWSMDVKIEGENAVRHMDLTTHNHASKIGATPPWLFAEKPARGKDPCAADKQKEEDACQDFKPQNPDGKDACKEAKLGGAKQSDEAWAEKMRQNAEADNAAAACIRARRCRLVPYTPNDEDKEKGNACCPSQTGDHLIPKASFKEGGKKLPNWPDYSPGRAPCMCAEGTNNTMGSHGLRHHHHKSNGPKGGPGTNQTISQETTRCTQGARTVFKSSSCQKGCIEAQLKNGHKGKGSGPIKYTPSGPKVEKKAVTKKKKSKPRKKARR